MFQAPYIGIDLDDCIVNGKINQFGYKVLNKCRSYAEYSPSRTGVHIFMSGSLDRAIKNLDVGFEAYQTERYFTVTEKPIYPLLPIRQLDFNLAELLPLSTSTQNGDSTKHQGWLEEALDKMKIGNIDNTLMSVLGKMRNDGWTQEAAFLCLQPLALNRGATENHVRDKIINVWGRYEPKERTAVFGQSESIEAFLQAVDKVEWICEPIIPKQAIGFVCGLPETLKTWMLIDLAIEAAKGGGFWLGKFPVKGAKILFIDQERWKGETQRRLKAVLSAKGLNSSDISQTLYIRVGTTTRLDLDQSYEAFRKELDKLRPDIIIVDSFVTFHTREENNRKDIQEVLERVKALRNEFGCTFIFIDHEGKGAFMAEKEKETPSFAYQAGSIAKPASAEFELTVRRQQDDSSIVYHTKNTQGKKVGPFFVKVCDVENGIRVEAF